jgi:nucleoside-diphosphate-sugar epimerase
VTKVLVTGASGFIGKHVMPLLLDRGFEVHAVAREAAAGSSPDVKWHQADLLAPGAGSDIAKVVEPDSVLHLAWCAQPKTYLTSPDNERWLRATEELVDASLAAGATRFVGLGTVLEYDLSAGICDEAATPAQPDTPYGIAKNDAGKRVLSAGNRHGVSSAWVRLFHPYGPGEPAEKLVSHICTHLLQGKKVPLSDGAQIRDYVYISDVASALALLVEDRASGVFNLGSGRGTSIREIAETAAGLLERPDLLGLGDLPPDTKHPRIVAVIQRLRSLGWEPSVDLESGVTRTIGSLR